MKVLIIFLTFALIHSAYNQGGRGPPAPDDYDYSNEDQGSDFNDGTEDLVPIKKEKNDTKNVNVIIQQFIKGDTNTEVNVAQKTSNTKTNTNISRTNVQIKNIHNQKGAKAKAKKRPQCIPCNNHQQCRRKSKRLTQCYPVKCRGAFKGTCAAPAKGNTTLPKNIPICPKTIVSNGQRICKVRR